ncbi:DgyrCDS8385 [Dimorphilus gyrociliatus]|uniref:DgyrCDS8385 n=1 Tax=Dimorphilus gyrociliatus TaxID=2664684 RepID=A0A7I8VVJ7_9ANNE|nr:DgyrCDS8385 [Dimorphilus gyrociliatus]
MACFHKLLSFGADPDPRDTFGNTPNHYAAEDGAVDILDVLLNQKVNVNAQDITSKTPLMKATRNGKLNAVKRLIKAKALLNICDRNMDTALHFAARQGSEALVSALIEAGADVNLKNHWGHTPLFEAVNYNNKAAAVRLLVVPSCNVNASDNKTGDTALHVAIHLLKFNYDFNTPARQDGDGQHKSIVRLALERKNVQVLHLLSQIGYVITTEGIREDEYEVLQNLYLIIPPVRTLKQLCRKTIRQCLGFGIRVKMNNLGLPATLQSYLLLDDILHKCFYCAHRWQQCATCDTCRRT